MLTQADKDRQAQTGRVRQAQSGRVRQVGTESVAQEGRHRQDGIFFPQFAASIYKISWPEELICRDATNIGGRRKPSPVGFPRDVRHPWMSSRSRRPAG